VPATAGLATIFVGAGWSWMEMECSLVESVVPYFFSEILGGFWKKASDFVGIFFFERMMIFDFSQGRSRYK